MRDLAGSTAIRVRHAPQASHDRQRETLERDGHRLRSRQSRDHEGAGARHRNDVSRHDHDQGLPNIPAALILHVFSDSSSRYCRCTHMIGQNYNSLNSGCHRMRSNMIQPVSPKGNMVHQVFALALLRAWQVVGWSCYPPPLRKNRRILRIRRYPK